MTLDEVSEIAYEVNRAYAQSHGDDGYPCWEKAPLWLRDATVSGVKEHILNPGAGPIAIHERWLTRMQAHGWRYGPSPRPDQREHPSVVPFEQLPESARAKSFIMAGLVAALSAGDPALELVCQLSA